MKHGFVTLMAFALVIAALALGAQAQGGPCSNSTLKGTYGALITGYSNGLPFAALDVVTSNGTGTFSGTGTISYNGVISQGVPISATYSVNNDCSGFADFSTGTTQTLLISADGTEVQFLRTDDPNSQVTGNAKKMRQGCGDANLSGHYAARLDGFISGLPYAALDQVAADGNGNASGLANISYGGTVFSSSFTATYSVTSNCSGSISFSNGVTENFAIVNGNEVRFIRTDLSDAVVTGIASKQ